MALNDCFKAIQTDSPTSFAFYFKPELINQRSDGMHIPRGTSLLDYALSQGKFDYAEKILTAARKANIDIQLSILNYLHIDRAYRQHQQSVDKYPLLRAVHQNLRQHHLDSMTTLDARGRAPLHHAVLSHDRPNPYHGLLVTILANTSDKNIKTSAGETAYMLLVRILYEKALANPDTLLRKYDPGHVRHHLETLVKQGASDIYPSQSDLSPAMVGLMTLAARASYFNYLTYAQRRLIEREIQADQQAYHSNNINSFAVGRLLLDATQPTEPYVRLRQDSHLINGTDAEGQTPAMYACYQNGRYRSIPHHLLSPDYLIGMHMLLDLYRFGANMRAVDNHGLTLLHHAARAGNMDAYHFIRLVYPEAVSLLDHTGKTAEQYLQAFRETHKKQGVREENNISYEAFLAKLNVLLANILANEISPETRGYGVPLAAAHDDVFIAWLEDLQDRVRATMRAVRHQAPLTSSSTSGASSSSAYFAGYSEGKVIEGPSSGSTSTSSMTAYNEAHGGAASSTGEIPGGGVSSSVCVDGGRPSTLGSGASMSAGTQWSADSSSYSSSMWRRNPSQSSSSSLPLSTAAPYLYPEAELDSTILDPYFQDEFLHFNEIPEESVEKQETATSKVASNSP